MKLKKEIKTSSEARLILSRIKLVLSCIVLLKSVNALFEEALNENQNLLSASQKRIIHGEIEKLIRKLHRKNAVLKERKSDDNDS